MGGAELTVYEVLIKVHERAGLSIEEVFRKVRIAVSKETGRAGAVGVVVTEGRFLFCSTFPG